MDYIEIITHFITPIVKDINSVKIVENESNSSKDRYFIITCSKEDMGRLIGKHGTTANALREVISIAGKNNSQHIHIKIVSDEESIEEIVTDTSSEEENPQ